MKTALLVGSPGGVLNFGRLDCTTKDVSAIKKLLDASGEYSAVVVLDDPSSEELKGQLRSFATHEGHKKSELFFYFSGHGYWADDELFYVTSDFNTREPSFTGLSDSDLLTFVRDANPALFVHVCDACFSGKRLLKSQITQTKGEIKNMIRFSSSAEDEISIGGHELSLFTDHFIEACIRKPEGEVFYSDIHSALTDSFRNNGAQLPYVFLQAPVTANFCSDARRFDEIRSVYNPSEKFEEEVGMNSDSESESIQLPQSLEERLLAVERRCNTIDAMEKFLESMKAKMEAVSLTDELTAYKLQIEISQSSYFDSIEDLSEVVNSLLAKSRVDNFVEAVKKDVTKVDYDPLNLVGLTSVLGALKPREYTYHLFNNSSLKNLYWNISVFSDFSFIGSFKAELIVVPSLLDCDVFLRLGYARPNGKSRSFEGEKTGKWTVKTIPWDLLPERSSQWLADQLENLIKRRTSEVISHFEDKKR